MAIRLIDRVPMDRIESQAEPVQFGRLLAALVVGVFYLAGFVARREWRGLGLLLHGVSVGVGWAVAAARTGWQDAGMPAEERRRARAA